MTVTRELGFELGGSFASAVEVARQVLQSHPQCDHVQEIAGEPFVFHAYAHFNRDRFGGRYSQQCLLDVMLSQPSGSSVAVHLKLTSPPAVGADVFGGYNKFLGRLRDQLITLARTSQGQSG